MVLTAAILVVLADAATLARVMLAP